MTALLEAKGISAGYGSMAVVHDFNLRVEAGEIVCILGANGAGKTTTLLTLAGALSPLAGDVEVSGERMTGRGVQQMTRRRVTLVPEGRGLFMNLTVGQNLRLRAHRRSKVAAPEVLATLPALQPLLNRRTALLSGGEQQMLAIAGALIGDPQVLMLDEMSLGLAPLIVENLLKRIRAIVEKTGIGVILVEQHVHAALSAADRGYILHRGKTVAAGPVDDLRREAETLQASYLGRASM
jgi:branched-chain amino acid transport system ATP-binding protein